VIRAGARSGAQVQVGPSRVLTPLWRRPLDLDPGARPLQDYVALPSRTCTNRVHTTVFGLGTQRSSCKSGRADIPGQRSRRARALGSTCTACPMASTPRGGPLQLAAAAGSSQTELRLGQFLESVKVDLFQDGLRVHAKGDVRTFRAAQPRSTMPT